MEKAKTAENESPVTAEDFYYSQAEFNRWLRDIMPHEEDHLKSMLEEYGQLCAEQARQEERRKSFEMLEMLQSCLSFIEELKNHGIDNWSDEGKLRALIKKATTI